MREQSLTEKITREYARTAGKGILVKPHQELFPGEGGVGAFVAVHPKKGGELLRVAVYPKEQGKDLTAIVSLETKGKTSSNTIYHANGTWKFIGEFPRGPNGKKMIDSFQRLHAALEKHAP